MMQAGKICAVVVTYNRKMVLKRCIDALLGQTRPVDLIFVVDNASTDGTEQMLRREYARSSRVKYVNLGENLGGSGGFHHGVQYALRADFDWMWLMDDDCLPAENCLEILLENIDDKNQIYSPAVLSLEDRRTFLWGIKGKVGSGNHEVRSSACLRKTFLFTVMIPSTTCGQKPWANAPLWSPTASCIIPTRICSEDSKSIRCF